MIDNTIKVSRDDMKSEFLRILVKHGMEKNKVDKCADIFTVNSLEGIYSHGVKRFPRFVFIGWTNACVNMPSWGAKDARIGNNPFVIVVPYRPEAIILDFAIKNRYLTGFHCN